MGYLRAHVFVFVRARRYYQHAGKHTVRAREYTHPRRACVAVGVCVCVCVSGVACLCVCLRVRVCQHIRDCACTKCPELFSMVLAGDHYNRKKVLHTHRIVFTKALVAMAPSKQAS